MAVLNDVALLPVSARRGGVGWADAEALGPVVPAGPNDGPSNQHAHLLRETVLTGRHKGRTPNVVA